MIREIEDELDDVARQADAAAVARIKSSTCTVRTGSFVQTPRDILKKRRRKGEKRKEEKRMCAQGFTPEHTA